MKNIFNVISNWISLVFLSLVIYMFRDQDWNDFIYKYNREYNVGSMLNTSGYEEPMLIVDYLGIFLLVLMCWLTMVVIVGLAYKLITKDHDFDHIDESKIMKYASYILGSLRIPIVFLFVVTIIVSIYRLI